MKERITVNPQIHFGKPCVSGTRIPVQEVLKSFDGKITAKELEVFIKSREPKEIGVKALMLIHCKSLDEVDEKQEQ